MLFATYRKNRKELHNNYHIFNDKNSENVFHFAGIVSAISFFSPLSNMSVALKAGS